MHLKCTDLTITQFYRYTTDLEDEPYYCFNCLHGRSSSSSNLHTTTADNSNVMNNSDVLQRFDVIGYLGSVTMRSESEIEEMDNTPSPKYVISKDMQ